MKTISAPLFAELKASSARIDVGWLLVRADGERFGFTSSDIPFVYGGDTYYPSNGFNPSAVVSKANMSVDNMECQVLESDTILDSDIRAGVWDNAAVNVFWICRYHPEWGVVPLRGGTLGEIVIKEGEWTTQLRSLFQLLQQPFGYFYSLQCMAQLGDARCKVNLDAPVWQRHQAYQLGILTDAGIGSVVKPTTPNGFWYVANYTTYVFTPPPTPPVGSPGGPGYSGLPPVVLIGSISGSELTVTEILSGGNNIGVGDTLSNGVNVGVDDSAPQSIAPTLTILTLGTGTGGTGTYELSAPFTADTGVITATPPTVGGTAYPSGTDPFGGITGTTGGGSISLTGGVITSPSGYDGFDINPNAPRTPSQPGQGLSGNDDLGPNDDTQVSAGPAFDSLSQFTYQGEPVDIFGIEI